MLTLLLFLFWWCDFSCTCGTHLLSVIIIFSPDFSQLSHLLSFYYKQKLATYLQLTHIKKKIVLFLHMLAIFNFLSTRLLRLYNETYFDIIVTQLSFIITDNFMVIIEPYHVNLIKIYLHKHMKYYFV